eukprot:COSAG01_NODE_1924_length_8886_cov_6.780699_10_plen_100_part_00
MHGCTMCSTDGRPRDDISGYATFCALAGVNKTDERGAKANLPPVDGLNLWPYLSGSAQHSPRTEVFADPKVLVMEVDGKKWKVSVLYLLMRSQWAFLSI